VTALEAARPTPRGRNEETSIQKNVLRALRAVGIMAWRANPIAPPLRFGDRIVYRSNATGATGVSDLIGVCPGGRFIAVEVKSSKGKLRPKQALFLDAVTRLGGIAVLARSTDDVVRLLGPSGAQRVTWYGLQSPFALTPQERSRYEAAALREDVKKARRRHESR